MRRSLISALLPGILASVCLHGAAFAQLTTQTMTLQIPVSIDYWQYENASTPNQRTLAPVWVLPPDITDSSRRHATDILVFDLPGNLPPIVDVLEAKVRFYDIPQAAWLPTGETTTDGIPSRLELFAAGFGPTYNENTWNGTQPLKAGLNDRDPYPRDLVMNVNVENEITTSTAWALGQPIGYTPGGMSAPFPIDFTFNLSDQRVRLEFLNDTAQGRSSWVFSSTYEIDFIGDPGTLPNCVMTEGVGIFPGSAPPTLTLRVIVEVFNDVSEWTHYE